MVFGTRRSSSGIIAHSKILETLGSGSHELILAGSQFLWRSEPSMINPWP
jgi:hypothetical protein